MLSRLERRLPLLTGAGRDLPTRQRTMRDAIAWSLDLLDVGERVLFRRLAVFAGGLTLGTAEAVAESEDGTAGIDGVRALVEQCLPRTAPGASVEPRLRMLETVRLALAWFDANGETDALHEPSVVSFGVWLARGHCVEGLRWLGRVLDRSVMVASTASGRAWVAASALSLFHGDYTRVAACGADIASISQAAGGPLPGGSR